MTTAHAPDVLRHGYLDGWPPSTPVGAYLEALVTGAPERTAALVADLEPRQVVRWLARGTRLLEEAEGLMRKITPGRRPFAALVHAHDRAIAQCEAQLRATIMTAATGEEGDWRAAAWLLAHRDNEPTVAEPEAEQAVEDVSVLAVPVITAA